MHHQLGQIVQDAQRPRAEFPWLLRTNAPAPAVAHQCNCMNPGLEIRVDPRQHAGRGSQALMSQRTANALTWEKPARTGSRREGGRAGSGVNEDSQGAHAAAHSRAERLGAEEAQAQLFSETGWHPADTDPILKAPSSLDIATGCSACAQPAGGLAFHPCATQLCTLPGQLQSSCTYRRAHAQKTN